MDELADPTFPIGKLDAEHTRELTERLREAGVSIYIPAAFTIGRYREQAIAVSEQARMKASTLSVSVSSAA